MHKHTELLDLIVHGAFFLHFAGAHAFGWWAPHLWVLSTLALLAGVTAVWVHHQQHRRS